MYYNNVHFKGGFMVSKEVGRYDACGKSSPPITLNKESGPIERLVGFASDISMDALETSKMVHSIVGNIVGHVPTCNNVSENHADEHMVGGIEHSLAVMRDCLEEIRAAIRRL